MLRQLPAVADVCAVLKPNLLYIVSVLTIVGVLGTLSVRTHSG